MLKDGRLVGLWRSKANGTEGRGQPSRSSAGSRAVTSSPRRSGSPGCAAPPSPCSSWSSGQASTGSAPRAAGALPVERELGGDAVRARQQRAARAQADGAGRDRVEAVLGHGRPRSAGAPFGLRAEEQGEAGSQQVERGAAGLDPGVRDARPEVDVKLLGHAADRPVRVDRALHVVLGDRPALALVGVEQLVVRPSEERPGELPAEVAAVADRRVHPGATAGGDAVRRVAGKEGPALAEAVGEQRSVGEAPDPADAHLAQGRSRGNADAALKAIRGGVGRVDHSRIGTEAVDPAVATAHGHERAVGRIGMGDRVDGMARPEPTRSSRRTSTSAVTASRTAPGPACRIPSSSRTRLRTPSAPIR